MTRTTLILRSLRYYFRSHLAVLMGVVCATAALTGALIVGDSLRGSLREQALGRLGRFEFALQTPQFFRIDLAERLNATGGYGGEFRAAAPVLLMVGGLVNPETRARVEQVQIAGVDARFWAGRVEGEPDRDLAFPPDRSIVVNEPLAADLGIQAGDDVVLHVGRPSAISSETLLGRREERALSMRLQVERVIPARGLGALSLTPQQTLPRNAYVAAGLLQKITEANGAANTLLVAPRNHAGGSAKSGGDGETAVASLNAGVAAARTLADHGLRLQIDENQSYLWLEAEGLLIAPGVEKIAQEAASECGLTATPVMAYLANRISRVPTDAHPDERSVPYSVVAAIPSDRPPVTRFEWLTPSDRAPSLEPGQIALNSWTAVQLDARRGDRVRLDYFLTIDNGELVTREAEFTLAGIVEPTTPAIDRHFTPEYEGLTNADRITDWDPPFPMDLRKIRRVDEDYWDRYRTAPKAFVHIQDGERLWATHADTLGRYNSIRFYRAAADPPVDRPLRERLTAALLARLDPVDAGLQFRDLRKALTTASAGSTDFGGLFIGFSFFLIAAAAILLALLFRLGIEQRARQIGLLRAVGWTPHQLRNGLLVEGALVAAMGAAIGVPAAVGYAAVMLYGLRTWWSAAVRAPFLELHVAPLTLVIGVVAGLAVSVIAMLLSLRGLARRSPRSLMTAGASEPAAVRPPGLAGIGTPLTALAFAAALIAAGALGYMPQVGAFFGGGALLWITSLTALRSRLRSTTTAHAESRGLSFARFAAHNLARNPGRSLATVSLLSSATFLLTAIEAFRLSPPSTSDKASGTGGFEWVGQTSTPLYLDLNTPKGRAGLGLTTAGEQTLSGVRTFGFRLRPGDEPSCRSLYRAREPRIVGAPRDFIARGGFAFAGTEARDAEARANPWTLLDQPLDDGSWPVIGDEAAVQWQLHSGLGKTIEIHDERGDVQRLRFVALLSGSALQSELIVSDATFRRLFPSRDGREFFLFEHADRNAPLATADLERALDAYGLDAQSTAQRVADYFAVQNTYLSTFQALGGFGLLLGAVGLAAVMLRNLYDRRSELALLQAVGWPRARIAGLLVRENLILAAAGLACGAIPAVIAVIPPLMSRPGSPTWWGLLGLLGGVLAAAAIATALAIRALMKMPLTRELRSE